jgi:hypothetical protein
MPQAKITCISSGLREVLMHESRHLVNPATKMEYEKTLRALPACPTGMLIGIEAPGGRGRVKDPNAPKRAPSAYNLFVRKCVKDEGKDFKTCAVEWRKEKERAGGRR